jgi:hypothetical protein
MPVVHSIEELNGVLAAADEADDRGASATGR